MSETVKLIIEIPKSDYETICANKEDSIIAHDTCRRIANNGVPLDDLKLKIEQDMCFDMFDDYGNKTAIHKELWEILDNIGKEECECLQS